MRCEIKPEQLLKFTAFTSYIYVDGGKSYIDFSTTRTLFFIKSETNI